MSDKPQASVTINGLLPVLLVVLFTGLKLAGVIAWPWVWVLAPLWVPVVLALALATVAGFIILLRTDRK